MQKIVYLGPLDEVTVPAAGVGRAPVGVPVEVSDEHADKLLEQSDAWALDGSEAAKRAAAAVKAAAKRVVAEAVPAAGEGAPA